MNHFGVIEGFFGPQWSRDKRKSYAPYLQKVGADFFIYAPKQDPFLRKKWRDPWSVAYVAELEKLKRHFNQYGIRFGVGLSPFGLGETLSEEDQSSLRQKLNLLNELKIEILGLFFDDMPITKKLAQNQLKVVTDVRKHFSGKIIFCPSFYSPDPILDKVFGARPPSYLEDIACGLSADISIAWTGPKVISPELSREHLEETLKTLKRRPFIWENFFANDGPKNCKFLKLRPYSGRNSEMLQFLDGIGFNLMNQPELSKVLFLSSLKVLRDGFTSHEAFISACDELCSKELSSFLQEHSDTFLSRGLDEISSEEKGKFLQKLKAFSDPSAREIEDWLTDRYLVGTECLTD